MTTKSDQLSAASDFCPSSSTRSPNSPLAPLSIDIEVHPEKRKIIQIGAVSPNQKTLAFRGTFNIHDALKRLDDFCEGAEFVIGHNIVEHDIPFLKEVNPDLKLFQLPVADTLFLSPLAFPKNPYHRLVKDYKIVKETQNDPVEDARCTVSLFHDQCEVFRNMDKGIVGFYGCLLSRLYPNNYYGALFHDFLGAKQPDSNRMAYIWKTRTHGLVCKHRAEELYNTIENDDKSSVCLAYILAWVRVAGENSVLPSWVRRRFPQIPGFLDTLRSTPCLQKDCDFCCKHHNPVENLKRFFGFDHFLPVKDEFPPLQQQVVEEIVRGNNCLAVLPTGAGKSLCYQLPGLMKAVQRNVLTVIISPLQSLMKDQVDGLKQKGILNVGTINGLLTMAERKHVIEGIHRGDIDLVWLAPEQLRNATIKSMLSQREIGMVVIDEAHCFSKWGHDFRPDYLYIARFLNMICPESRLPQIVCFTATAKKEVIQEIKNYFKTELSLDIAVFEGGHERTNLKYAVESVSDNEKKEIIHDILNRYFKETEDEGGAIVFASTRERVERFSKDLTNRDWRADFYHGGRTPDDKRQIQEKFLSGELKVIVATNAFGMGVDKPDIRLVIHADVPGSLENYLQEAGRAGRDRKPAECYLLFNPEDMETQFKLSSLTRLEWRDVSGMFTGLKHLAEKSPEKTVIITSGELLNSEEMEAQNLAGISTDEPMYDTKVKTALSWLEKNGKIERGDNRTQVIQGQINVNSMAEALLKINELRLSDKEKDNWIRLLEFLFQSSPKELLNTDTLSHLTGIEPLKLMSVMHSMREAGIITHDLNMTAYVHRGISNDSKKRLEEYVKFEESLLSFMAEQEPNIMPQDTSILRTRFTLEALKDRDVSNARPHLMHLFLEMVRDDNLVRLIKIGEENYKLIFFKDWNTIREVICNRNSVSGAILKNLLEKIEPGTRGKDLLVFFRTGELIEALKSDLSTRHLDNLEERVRTGLLTLDKIKAISLQSGLAVFRPAMTIKVTALKEDKFSGNEFLPLKQFYDEKIVHIHVIGKYAELAMEKIGFAVKYVADYFQKDRNAFIKIYFGNKSKTLLIPTTQDSYDKIVDALNHPVQEKAVTDKSDKNVLIVAGPGSGKTRVIVHRIAYLIRVRRVLPRHILAVAFNRSSVTQLKLRLKTLIGNDAKSVRIKTYHSMAMSVTGRSLTGKSFENTSDVFKEILNEAIQVMEQQSVEDYGALSWRDALLSGLRYILVDEYQDINEPEYRFLSLLAGMNEKESGRRPMLMAVGDDDQNIYSWQGSNVEFIRRFEKDYNAEIVYMIDNYRSSPSIISASNALISKNTGRMKTSPITIAKSGENHRYTGKVNIIKTPNPVTMFKEALNQVQRILDEDKQLLAGDVCILCRTNKELDTLLIMARHMRTPVKGFRARRIPLTATREFFVLMDTLSQCQNQTVKGETLYDLVQELISESGFSNSNIWIESFKTILQNYLAETLYTRQPIVAFLDYIYDASRDIRQFHQPDKDKTVLATMHSAKGLEFPAVIIAGYPTKPTEDERRLYYVAMTRAQKRLYCLFHEQKFHPFINDLADCEQEHIEYRYADPVISPEDFTAFHTVIWELELTDVFISYPALHGVIQKAQMSLADMEPGHWNRLSLKENYGQYAILYDSHPIAMLSKKAASEYAKQVSRGYKANKIIFLASLKRYRRNMPDGTPGNEASESWYTGLFQILFQKVS